MKHSRIRRLMQILMTLQAGKPYAVDEFSRMFGTSRRTIFRDLKELQAIGVPYHYDPKAKGYRIKPDFFLPPLDLSLQEALSLLLLAHRANNLIQLPFRRSALLAALKIENNLPPQIRNYCNALLRNITTVPAAQAPTEHLDEVFHKLQQAIAKKRRVQLHYHSLYEGKIIELELWPYHLLYNNRAWYVLGRSSLHGTVRTFKLNRIRELVVSEKCFVQDRPFDPYEHFGRAWSMIPEGRIYNVKLRFSPKVAENVAEVRWHSTQKVTRHADGSATVEFRVDGLGEISWWILGYGDQVQVLAPKALRDRIVQVAKNMVKINESV